MDNSDSFYIYSKGLTLQGATVDKKICSASQPCGCFRTCPACARKRQADIADQAEKIAATGAPIFLTTIRPPENNEASLRATRAAIFRAGIAEFGLWTIETGQKFNGLHINVLSTKPKIPPRFAGLSWSEAINTSARAAAAYISKQSGMPSPGQYSGRLYGSFGNLKDLFVREDMPLMIQAAAIEQEIAYRPSRLASWERDYIDRVANTEPVKTRAEYMAIAKSHLPAIWALVEARQAKRR